MKDWRSQRRQIAGWLAVSISVGVACFWAFWGSIENFHEGWFSSSVWQNIALMLVQYLSPMLAVMLVSGVVLRWPRLALPVFEASALGAAWFFRRSHAAVELIAIPLAVLGLLYHFGDPQPRRWAFRGVVLFPIATAVVCGAYPGWRAMHRLDDGNYGMRVIEGNGVVLVWAPEGPGWPSAHASWQQARRSCVHLTADGRSLADEPQNLWRLPTVDEAVRSMVFRGRNAGGTWNPVLRQATYKVAPDKDSPLWKVHSKVIYWWTDTLADRDKAYRIAYNGYVLPSGKQGWGDYWAYRCVCEPSKLDTVPDGHK
jgi:hypothetical protein